MNEFDPTEIPTDDILEIDLGAQAERPQWKAGKVELFVDGYSVGPAQSSGKDQITWVLRAPSVNNWTFKHYTGLSDTSIWNTEAILVALGLAKPGDKVVLNKRQTLGRRFMAEIEMREYNEKFYPKIKKCFPHPKGPVDTDAAPF